MRAESYHKQEVLSFFPWGFHILEQWLQIKQQGESLKPYFTDNEIRSVAIYGLGAIGRRLYEELRLEQLEVVCGIDQNARNIALEGLKVKTLEEKLPEVDAVVVTPVSFYEIQKEIYAKMGKDVDIISVEDVVNYCYGRL